MSFLRRRTVEKSTSQPAEDTSAAEPTESLSIVKTSKLHFLKEKKSKRRNGLIFTLGGIVGIILAVFFANRHDVISFEGLMDLNLDSLIDVIPVGIVREARDITVCKKACFCMWNTLRLNRGLMQGDGFSDMSGKQSTMIHSPLDYICSRRGSRHYILS